jgi:hypothetical protein
MIKTPFPIKVTVIGSIKSGYTAAKVKCPCGENIAIKINNQFYCKQCKAPVSLTEDTKTFPLTTGHFIVPDSVMQVYGEKPTELTVIPAYPDKEKTFYTSFKKVGLKGRAICKGDGSIARRTDEQGKEQSIKCEGEYCEDFKSGRCKYYGSFLFYIPEVDIMNAFRLVTHSKITITNILSTLNRLTVNNKLLQIPCILRIREVNSNNKRFYIVELIPPSIPAHLIKQFLSNGNVDIIHVLDTISNDHTKKLEYHTVTNVTSEPKTLSADNNTQVTTFDNKTDNEVSEIDIKEKERVMEITITRLNKELNQINRTALVNYIESKAKKSFNKISADETKQILRKLLADKGEHYKYFVMCDQLAIKEQNISYSKMP